MNATRKALRAVGSWAKKHIVVLILAIVLEIVIAGSSVFISEYTLEGDVKSIFPQGSAQFTFAEYENGYYRVTGRDPQMELDTSDAGEIRTVLLELQQPLQAPMVCQVFYDNGSDGYRYAEEDSVIVTMLPNDTQCVIELPAAAYRSIRFDIDDDCMLSSISCTKDGYAAARVNCGKNGFSLLRLLILLALTALCSVACSRMLRLVKAVFYRVDKKRTIIEAAVLLVAAGVLSWCMYQILWMYGWKATTALKQYCVIVSLAIAVLVGLRKTVKEHPEIAFAVIALTAGVVMLFFSPVNVLHSWDEMHHIKNALNVSYFAENPKICELGDVWALLSGILIAAARYIGAGWDVFFFLGKLGNLLLYVLIGCFAIRRLKSGKLILSVLLLAPTNLFMASTYSYDPFITSCTALAFSYFFAEWQEPEKTLEWKNALIMVTALTIGVLPKPVYIVMLMLLLWMPQEKFASRRDRKVYYLLILLAVAVLVLSFLLPFLSDMDVRTDERGGSDVNAGAQVKYIFSHPLLYTRTLLTFLSQYFAPKNMADCMTSLAYRGMAPDFVLYLALLAVIAFTDKNQYDRMLSEDWKAKAYSLFVLFGTVCLFSTALYISFTPVGHSTINGCQQRYIMPVLFPAIYLLGTAKIKNDMNRAAYHGLVIAVAAYVAFGAVLSMVGIR